MERIRSLLPVATSALSKRWQTSWAPVQVIDFSDRNLPTCPPPGADNTAGSNTASRVSKFVFGTPVRYGTVVPLSKDFDFCRMDDWMRYVERNRVKELELHFRWGGYTLPQFLYENSSFEKLHLTDVYFKPEGRINWPSLKTLFLDGFVLNEDLFHNIFSGCPNLEELKLSFVGRYDSGFRFYDFRSCSRLRKLVIDCDQNNDELRILAPTLESLEIIGEYEDYQKFQINNSPSLTQAKLDLYAGLIIDGFSGNYVNMMTQLLQSLSHVRDFFIGNWCIQVLSQAALCKGFNCPRSTRKCLILDTCLDKWNLPGIASLLESSPEVETLVIRTLPEERSRGRRSNANDCWKSHEVSYFLEQRGVMFLHHVKTIKIVGFQDYGLELRFIEFLLANTPILERMIIHGEGEELSGISSRLSSFQKCSPDAIITGKPL